MNLEYGTKDYVEAMYLYSVQAPSVLYLMLPIPNSMVTSTLISGY